MLHQKFNEKLRMNEFWKRFCAISRLHLWAKKCLLMRSTKLKVIICIHLLDIFILFCSSVSCYLSLCKYLCVVSVRVSERSREWMNERASEQMKASNSEFSHLQHDVECGIWMVNRKCEKEVKERKLGVAICIMFEL